MRAVTLGENRQTSAAAPPPPQIPPRQKWTKYGSCSGHDAAGLKTKSLPVRVVHKIHTANNPFTLGNLIFHVARFGVIETQMIPAVALGHPDDFASVIEIFAKIFAGIINEGFTFLIHNWLHVATAGVHGNNTQCLMSALVEDKSEPRGIRVPSHVVYAPRIGKERIADRGISFFVSYIEEMRFADRHVVAGFSNTDTNPVSAGAGLRVTTGCKINAAVRAGLMPHGDGDA